MEDRERESKKDRYREKKVRMSLREIVRKTEKEILMGKGDKKHELYVTKIKTCQT